MPSLFDDLQAPQASEPGTGGENLFGDLVEKSASESKGMFDDVPATPPDRTVKNAKAANFIRELNEDVRADENVARSMAGGIGGLGSTAEKIEIPDEILAANPAVRNSRSRRDSAIAGLEMDGPGFTTAITDAAKLDFTGRLPDEPKDDARVLSNGQVVVRPKLSFSEDFWNKAIDATTASPEAKAQAKARRLEVRDELGEAFYDGLLASQTFKEWVEGTKERVIVTGRAGTTITLPAKQGQPDADKAGPGELVERFLRERAGDQGVMQLDAGLSSGFHGIGKGFWGFLSFLGLPTEEITKVSEEGETRAARIAESLGGATWTNKLASGAVSLVPMLATGGATGILTKGGAALTEAQIAAQTARNLNVAIGAQATQTVGQTFMDAQNAGYGPVSSRLLAVGAAVPEAVVTKGFGATGAESFANAGGSVGSGLLAGAKAAGKGAVSETAEEGLTTLGQSPIQATIHPDFDLGQAMKDTVMVAPVLGGAMSAATQMSQPGRTELAQAANTAIQSQAAKVGPMTAAAAANPSVQAALDKLASEAGSAPAPAPAQKPLVASIATIATEPPIDFSPFDNAGGFPSISEREDGSVEPAENTVIADVSKHPVLEVPVGEIFLSEDVPNFKESASSATGVVEGQELQGKYERLGTPPIVVWERADGRKEVITGRHRLDLAKRTGEQTIPAQVVREKDGFSKEQALVFDAESNIRDGQGSTKDYAHYFRNTAGAYPDKASAESRGLLSRAKGRDGWALGRDASDDTYAAFAAGKIGERAAVAIAKAAPGDANQQRVGVKYALDNPRATADEIKHRLNAALAAKAAGLVTSDEQGDLFGNNDAAIQAMERASQIAQQLEADAREDVKILRTAMARKGRLELTKKEAERFGIKKTDDAAAIAEALRAAETRAEGWDTWHMDKAKSDAVMARARGQASTTEKVEPEPPKPEPVAKPAEAGKPKEAAKTKPTFKKTENFQSDGIWEVTLPDGRKFRMFRDPESKYWYDAANLKGHYTNWTVLSTENRNDAVDNWIRNNPGQSKESTPEEILAQREWRAAELRVIIETAKGDDLRIAERELETEEANIELLKDSLKKRSGKTEPTMAPATKTPEQLLKEAEPFTVYGPNYNRNIATSAQRLKQDVERNSRGIADSAAELELRLVKWGKLETPTFDEMVEEAQRWKGAALKADSLYSPKDIKARLAHNNATTKGDLDAYLMRKFGVDAVTARNVSNELTKKNLPADSSALVSDFKGEPWADNALEAEAKTAETPDLAPGEMPFNLTDESAAEKAARLKREEAEAVAKEEAQRAADKAESDKLQLGLFGEVDAAAKEAVVDIASPPTIKTLNTAADATMDLFGGDDSVQRSISDGHLVEGVFIVTPDGKRTVVLFVDAIAEVAAATGKTIAERAAEVARHEIVHDRKSVGALFTAKNRREYRSIIDGTLKRYSDAELRELAELYDFDLSTEEGREAAAEEIMAREGERGSSPSWLDGILSSVASLMRRIGWKGRLTDVEVRVMLDKASRARVPSSSGKSGAKLSKRAVEATDADYMAAVERGDMDAAQRMVDERRLLPRRIFYVRDVEIIRNPTPGDYASIAKSYNKEFPFDRSGDPKSRFTTDELGNRWIWRSDLGMHSAIEPGITAEEGRSVNQNAFNFNRSVADPVTYDAAGNIIPLSERFNEASNDIRFAKSRRNVEFDPASAKTQIAGTVKTYKKAATLLPSGKVLDFGAGLGLGSEAIAATGRTVESYEPFPQRWIGKRPVTFTDTESIPDNSYDGVVNFSVLNVVKPEVRDTIVADIGRVLKPGGVALITARDSGDVKKAAIKTPSTEPGGFIIGTGEDARYQKGFSQKELKEYVSRVLGSGFTVENNSELNGASIRVTKNPGKAKSEVNAVERAKAELEEAKLAFDAVRKDGENRFEAYKEMQKKRKAYSAAIVDSLLEETKDGGGVIFRSTVTGREDATLILSPDISGGWRVTQFDKHVPYGHFVFPGRENAIRAVAGESHTDKVKGPPYFGLGPYKVETMTPKKGVGKSEYKFSKRRRAQVFGNQNVGQEYEVRNVEVTSERIRAEIFDGVQDVSSAATEAAWRLAHDWASPSTRYAVAGRVWQAGGNALAPGIAQGELMRYARKMAANGDTSLVNFLNSNSNLFPMTVEGASREDWEREVNASTVGALLNGRRWLGSPSQRAISGVAGERDRIAGEAIGDDAVLDLREALLEAGVTAEEVLDALKGLKAESGESFADIIARLVGPVTNATDENPLIQAIIQLARRGYAGELDFTFTAGPKADVDLTANLKPVLANIRDFLVKKGAKGLESDWWMGLAGPRAPEGALWTADKAMNGQLSGILRDAMKRLGLVNEHEAAKLTDAEKVAMTLGKPEFRRDKIAEVDERVRSEIEGRMAAEIEELKNDESLEEAELEGKIEAVAIHYAELMDAWEETTSQMSNQSVSSATMRRMIHSEIKARAPKSKTGKPNTAGYWSDALRSGALAREKDAVVNAIITDIRDVSNAPDSLDLTKLEAELRSAFDRIATLRQVRFDAAEAAKAVREAARRAAQPEKTAQAIVAEFAKLQSDTPDLKTNPRVNEVRQLFSDQWKGIGPKRDAALFVRDMTALGVSEATAATMFNIAERQREAHEVARKNMELIRAAERGSLEPLVQSILSSPPHRQLSPEWRRQTAVEYFLNSGLSQMAAESAATAFEATFAKRLEEAREAAAERVVRGSPKWQQRHNATPHKAMSDLDKIRRAVRAGVTDPDSDFAAELATERGWKGFTPAQHARLAELDGIMEDSDASEHERVRAGNEILDIARRAKVPESSIRTLAGSVAMNILSGISSIAINVVSPAFFSLQKLVLDSTIGGSPVLAARGFAQRFNTWWREFNYSIRNDTYTFGWHEHLDTSGTALKSWLEDGVRGVGAGSPSAALKLFFGLPDIVRRIHQSLDQAALAQENDYAKIMFGSRIMAESGLSNEDVHATLSLAASQQELAFASAIESGMSRDEARVYSLEVWRDTLSYAVGEVSPDGAAELDAAARREGQSIVGRRDTVGGKELAEGTATRGVDAIIGAISRMEEQVSRWVLSSGQKERTLAWLTILKRGVFGFIRVPFRVSQKVMANNPVHGLARYFFHKAARRVAEVTPYQQTWGTALQERQRVRELIGNSILFGIVAALMRPSDEPDEKKGENWITVTGNGPDNSDRGLRQAWAERNKPWSTRGKLFGVPFEVNLGRGAEAFMYQLAMLAAWDDAGIQKGQRKGKEGAPSMKLDERLAVSTFQYAASLWQRMSGGQVGRTSNLFDRERSTAPQMAGWLTSLAKNSLPLQRFVEQTTGFFTGKTDTSTIENVLKANVPYVGPMVGEPALNFLGDEIEDDFGSRLWKVGMPLNFRLKETPTNRAVYGLILKKGQSPTAPVRRTVENQFGTLTEKEWRGYLRTYGGEVKERIVDGYDRLSDLEPVEFNEALDEISDAARRAAVRELDLQEPE